MNIAKWTVSFAGLIFPAFASGGITGFEAVVTEYGQLENVIGDKLFEIDSLSVKGPVNESDFAIMLRGIVEGRISILNMENAIAEDEYLPPEAFKSATGLRKVILPSNLREISWESFQNSVNLEQVTITSRLRGIMPKAFEGCKSLKSINLNDGLWHISEYAFRDCSFDSILIPPSVERIGDASFAGNNLKKMYAMPKVAPTVVNYSLNCGDCVWDLFYESTPKDIPVYIPKGSSDSYRNIEGWDYLTNYIEIATEDFPLKLTKGETFVVQTDAEGKIAEQLDKADFAIDSLVVSGPINQDDIHSIWTRAYEGDVKVINLSDTKIKEGIIPALAFARRSGKKYNYLRPEVRRIMLPDDIVEIGDSAFYYSSVEVINLPQRLPSLGTACFYMCEKLKLGKVIIPEGVTSIADNCFFCCRHLSEIVLPSTLKHIGKEALNGTAVTSIELPEVMTSIGNSALSGTNITSIKLPSRLEHIGANAFCRSSKLADIELPATLITIGDSAFAGCRFEKIDFPESLISIGTEAFANSGLKEIVITPQLKHIGEAAFQCSKVENIVFPETEIEFAPKTFALCPRLTEITLPEWMTAVPARMFHSCSSLCKVNFPSSLKKIGRFAFASTALEELNLPDGLEVIEGGAFYYANYDAVVLPASVKRIGRFSFSAVNDLKYVKSYSPVPPECEDWDIFSMTPYTIPLYAPEESLDLYKAALGWKLFLHYYPINDTSATEMVTATQEGGYVEIYNATGMPVYRGMLEDASLPSGLYIVKSEGATYKIYR